MLWAMGLPAVACIGIGLFSFVAIPFVIRPALPFVGPDAGAQVASLTSTTIIVSIILWAIATITALAAVVLKAMGRGKRPIAQSVTWDCGYSLPGPTMQYTASSFTAPIVNYFKIPLAALDTMTADKQFLPTKPWKFHTVVDDWFLTRVFEPMVASIDRGLGSLRWIQNGKTGQYVFYIALTLLALIVWKFFL
jgi:hypothetical protein